MGRYRKKWLKNLKLIFFIVFGENQKASIPRQARPIIQRVESEKVRRENRNKVSTFNPPVWLWYFLVAHDDVAARRLLLLQQRQLGLGDDDGALANRALDPISRAARISRTGPDGADYIATSETK